MNIKETNIDLNQRNHVTIELNYDEVIDLISLLNEISGNWNNAFTKECKWTGKGFLCTRDTRICINLQKKLKKAAK